MQDPDGAGEAQFPSAVANQKRILWIPDAGTQY
jgi:hypothetical protein